MELLKNQRAWKRWAKKFDYGQSSKCSPPSEYPCFVYTVVRSFGHEEEQEVYLYQSDIERMRKQMAAALATEPTPEQPA